MKNIHTLPTDRAWYNTVVCRRIHKIIIPNGEIWKDVPEFEGYYQVSNLGNVKSLERYVKGNVENRLQKENRLSI